MDVIQPDPENAAINRTFGVSFDVISVLPRHLSHVPVLSERYPALRTVLDHLHRHPVLRARHPRRPCPQAGTIMAATHSQQ
jgi:hypothetical protein